MESTSTTLYMDTRPAKMLVCTVHGETCDVVVAINEDYGDQP